MGNNNMASRTMLSKILKTTVQSSLRGQQHPIRKVLSKNAPCIANVVYRKLSSSVIRRGDAGGPIEQRTPQEIKEYVEKEMKDQWLDLDIPLMTNFETRLREIYAALSLQEQSSFLYGF